MQAAPIKNKLTGWLSGNSRKLADLKRENDLLVKESNALRQQVKDLMLCGAPTELDRTLYAIPPPLTFDPWQWLSGFANNKDASILEIGSREVVGKSSLKSRLPLAQYTGLDFHAGPNVHVVGDAHKLSNYFAPNSFDVVYSTAVFEHLAMPWVVSEEIARVLRVGGVACISTHFSWSEHEMPWHFFQFNSTGLEVLFNQQLGFETIAAGKEMPMVGRFGYDCDPDHAGKPIANLYCSSYIITRKVRDQFLANEQKKFCWRNALEGVYGTTQYPPGTSVMDSDVSS